MLSATPSGADAVQRCAAMRAASFALLCCSRGGCKVGLESSLVSYRTLAMQAEILRHTRNRRGPLMSQAAQAIRKKMVLDGEVLIAVTSGDVDRRGEGVVGRGSFARRE